MPLLVEQDESTTILKLQQRCSVEDIAEILPLLTESLQKAPSFKCDFSSTDSVDTPVVQLILSAARSADKFLSGDDPYLYSTLRRWGLSSTNSKLV